MSRAKTSLAALAVALAGVTACASTPDPEAKAAAELQAAVEAAMKPATPEEIEAANNSDPLTKANFWSKEYAKDAENLDNALTFADALRGIGSTERAVEVLSEVLVIHPNEPRILMPLGRALAANGNQLGAARAFEQVAVANPDRAEAWAALGTAMDQLENHQGAQVAYEKALAIEPGRASTLANYGLSLALTGDLAGAEAKLRQAVTAEPGDVRVRENLALVLGLQGRFDEMQKTSAGFAPDKIVEQNVELLKDMIQSDSGAEPAAGSTASQTVTPLPAKEAPPAEATGLRLRRTGG
ncbi:tetratricopeptide repeat protein [uncultured Hyphomonas sp.]|uniref:tetratricopeptide repeat protein n=1 Tax=uncultured Hyphomonas sp. TaxID=225298 RepID=UPI002AAB6DEB|nr:tetratricopeptide repeat protein [uncultured Hyphomonas sp.]